MIGSDKSTVRDFVDALRDALGLAPLYATDELSPQFTLYESVAQYGDDGGVWQRLGSAADYEGGVAKQTELSVARHRLRLDMRAERSGG